MTYKIYKRPVKNSKRRVMGKEFTIISEGSSSGRVLLVGSFYSGTEGVTGVVY